MTILKVNYCSLLLSFIVIIGFVEEFLTVSEPDGSATLRIAVMEGESVFTSGIANRIVLLLNTEDGNAISK